MHPPPRDAATPAGGPQSGHRGRVLRPLELLRVSAPPDPRYFSRNGSLKMDVPKNHISRMHNVNHFIVSQTNPHVLPFMSERNPDNAALFAIELIKSTARVNVEHVLDKLRRHTDSPAFGMVLDKAHSVAAQTYSGDITIFPHRQASNIFNTFVDPTAAHVADFVADGQRATWPHLERIRNTTRISRAFERCLQRINGAKHEAKRDSRQVIDGEVVPACGQACPSQAITFGNIVDPESKISKLRESSLHYGMLSELNVKPRTTYLAKVRNPNPKLA